MKADKIVETLNRSVMAVKDLKAAAQNLVDNHENLDLFLSNNPQFANVPLGELSMFVTGVITKMINDRHHPSVIKNIYDEYSIMFILGLMSQTSKSTTNALTRILINTLGNSSKYDIYKKKNVNAMRHSSDDQIIELFWLIPLLVNPKAIIAGDSQKYINVMKQIKTPDFVEGYLYYVLNVQPNLKEQFKLFINESMMVPTN